MAPPDERYWNGTRITPTFPKLHKSLWLRNKSHPTRRIYIHTYVRKSLFLKEY